ncbi:MAG: DUF1801 domain-containing protein [Myxococcota bacterium]|nr:DUF1801 domain-containing protein [Myxococcota bacterium]
MQSKANTVKQYIAEVPEARRGYFVKLRQTILDNLPQGFEEQMSYSMIGYVVPHRIYPSGYHCDPKLPLPFVSIASQKHFIGFYHMGIYANETLLQWFVKEYPKHCKTKLDMGKSCIRLKKVEQIPYQLIGETMQQMSVDDWIRLYEEKIKR